MKRKTNERHLLIKATITNRVTRFNICNEKKNKRKTPLDKIKYLFYESLSFFEVSGE